MIRGTRRVAVFVALSVSLLIALALSVPHWVHGAVQRAFDDHDAVHATGIHVRPTLAIEVQSLRVDAGPFQLHCTGATIHPSLRPAALFGRTTRRLNSTDIQHCTIVAALHSSDSGSRAGAHDGHPDEHDTLDLSQHPLRARIDALYGTLRTQLSILGSLHIHHADLDIRRDTHHIEGVLSDLLWRDHDGAPHLSTHLSLSKDIHAQSLAVDLKFKGKDSTLRVTSAAPVRIKDRELTIESVELRNARSLHIPTMQVHAPTQRLDDIVLHGITLRLDTTASLDIERGQIELPALDLPSIILQYDRNTGVPAAFPPEHGEENGEETREEIQGGGEDSDEVRAHAHTPAAQEVWSLRTLARARNAVARLQDFFVTNTAVMDGERWPLSFDIRDVAILHDAEPLMEVSTLRFSDETSLFLDARIADAQIVLRADPQEGGHWKLRLQNASLSRIAMFFELEEHLSGYTDASIDIVLQDSTLSARGNASIRHMVLDHSKVSEMRVGPMNMRGEFSSTLPASPAHDASLSAEFSFNGLPLMFHLDALPTGDQTRFVSSLVLAEQSSCQSVWDAVPAGLVPDLGHSALTFRGSMQPTLSLNYIGGAFHTFELRSDGFPGNCTLRMGSPHWSPQKLNQNDYVLHVQEGVTRDDIFVGPGTEDYVAIDDLPSYVPAVMYLSEEIAFYTNGALSLGLINRGIRHILPRKRFAYGGSTVTQQLVKNLYFTRTKTLARKFQEAIVAWAVTEEVDKDRVLELYMNCIEFGPNLYGIVRASRYYFDKEPADLTVLEATWLASLKPSPRRGERDFKRGYSDFENWNSQRIETLLNRLVQYGGHIAPEDIDDAAPFVVYFPNSPNAGSRPKGLAVPVDKPVTSQDFTDNAP